MKCDKNLLKHVQLAVWFGVILPVISLTYIIWYAGVVKGSEYSYIALYTAGSVISQWIIQQDLRKHRL